jgi:hypothetical protein
VKIASLKKSPYSIGSIVVADHHRGIASSTSGSQTTQGDSCGSCACHGAMAVVVVRRGASS